MNDGTRLLSLKQEARSAYWELDDRKHKFAGWFFLGWVAAAVAAVSTMALLLSGIGGVFNKHPSMTQMEGVWHLVGAVATGTFAYFAFSAPYIWEARDKEAIRLEALNKEKHDAYSQALKDEIASYGIVTSSIVNHTQFMDSNYEFTALRNGEPVDVTVRDFNDEVVFMLNGERMQKPVTV